MPPESTSTNEPEDIPTFNRGRRSAPGERVVQGVLRAATYAILLCFALILGRIILQGAPVILKAEAPFIRTEFFSERPQILVKFYDENFEKHRMTMAEFRAFEEANPDAIILAKKTHNYSAGGIFSPLIGTLLIVTICIVFAMSIGISASIYLSEYARRGAFISAIRLAILNLAGVPSIVFGLFGLAFFCFTFPVIIEGTPAERAIFVLPLFGDYKLSFQGWEQCMLAAGCTLAAMILPVIITACEESLRAVPRGNREASLALGATRWQTIRKAVLPYALPGMLTASVLGITRVAGETAPIMYTGALASGDLPWVGLGREETPGIFGNFGEFFMRSVEAMPYHIYTVSTKIPQEDAVKPMQYGSVLVFMMIVMSLAALSVYLRSRLRKKYKW